MPAEADVPPISSLTLTFFTRVVRRYFRRHFRSVMGQGLENLQRIDGPLIVYMNHSSWWDPMLCILLARMLLPHRRHYAPMDAAALARYRILRKVGLFGVDAHSTRGVAKFLRVSQAVLAGDGVLWLTPQGRFADTREKPLAFMPGLGHLIARMPTVTLLPLAIEYTFWNERLPEALLRFGAPVARSEGDRSQRITELLEPALASEMLKLQEASCARDAAAFRVLLQGGRGTGGFYALAEHLRSFFGGKTSRDHSPRE
jgi:1-acyl-sn-glycerol-3-phosphate acyltransferase